MKVEQIDTTANKADILARNLPLQLHGHHKNIIQSGALTLQALIANKIASGKEDVENHQIMSLVPVTHQNCSEYTSNSITQYKAHVKNANVSVDNRTFTNCDSTAGLGHI